MSKSFVALCPTVTAGWQGGPRTRAGPGRSAGEVVALIESAGCRHFEETERAVCHEYGMGWRQPENTEKKKTEDAKPDLKGAFRGPDEDLPKAPPADKVEAKELEPAK